MMVMSRLASDSREALSSALVRAKMCEICASSSTGAQAAVAFTAGLLSARPGILDRALPELVNELALSSELRSALLDGIGPVGRVLEWVLGYEEQDQGRLAALGAPLLIANAYIEAVRWSTELETNLARANH